MLLLLLPFRVKAHISSAVRSVGYWIFTSESLCCDSLGLSVIALQCLGWKNWPCPSLHRPASNDHITQRYSGMTPVPLPGATVKGHPSWTPYGMGRGLHGSCITFQAFPLPSPSSLTPSQTTCKVSSPAELQPVNLCLRVSFQVSLRHGKPRMK